MTGIEPAYSAWEADVLPLNYIGMVLTKDSNSVAVVHLVPGTQPIDSLTKMHSSCRVSSIAGIDTLSRRNAR